MTTHALKQRKLAQSGIPACQIKVFGF